MHDRDHNGLPNNKVQVTIITKDVQLESLSHKTEIHHNNKKCSPFIPLRQRCTGNSILYGGT